MVYRSVAPATLPMAISEWQLMPGKGKPRQSAASAAARAISIGLRSIAKGRRAFLSRAHRAAIDFAALFDAMPNDSALAVRAGRGHCLNRAFEAVEGHRAAVASDLKCLVVFVSTDIACRHDQVPPRMRPKLSRRRCYSSCFSVHRNKTGGDSSGEKRQSDSAS